MNMKKMIRGSVASAGIAIGTAISISISIVGCVRGSGDVTIQSTQFSTSVTGLLENGGEGSGYALGAAVAQTTVINEFKFCVRSVRLENESDQAETKDGQDEVEFRPELIDLKDGAAKTWGTVNVPVGFKARRIKVKVHKDDALCGMSDSIRFNGASTQQDVELKWRFAEATDLSSGDTLKLTMDALVNNLVTKVINGGIRSLKDGAEEVEGSVTN